jgi:hypothetical protein
MGKNTFLDDLLREFSEYTPTKYLLGGGESDNTTIVSKCNPLIKIANQLSQKFKNYNINCSSIIKLANQLSEKIKNRDSIPTTDDGSVTQEEQVTREETQPTTEELQVTTEPSIISDTKCLNGKRKLILGIQDKKNSVNLCLESDNNAHIDSINDTNLNDDDIEIFVENPSLIKTVQ